MGHIVFAAPSVQRFHLHERLARKLQSRGHRVTVLSGDPVSHRCYASQGFAAVDLRPGRPIESRLPLDEFALQDCQLAGEPSPGAAPLAAAQRRLARLVRPSLDFFAKDLPDVVLIHQERSGLHRLLHFVAREHNAHVLHTADGYLPGTLQSDHEGIDGDASFCRRAAVDYRDAGRDETFLAAALAAWLGRAFPPPLARTPLPSPSALGRIEAMARAVARGQFGPARAALAQWQHQPRGLQALADQVDLPRVPFVLVLLQREDAPQLRLDAPWHPGAEELVACTARAVHAIDPGLQLVATLPDGGLPRATRQRLAAHTRLLPAHAVPAAISTALAIVTINHPQAVCALLAGTPVLHSGRTPYGVAGVARKTSLDTLAQDLQHALGHEQPYLRERFLTRFLGQDHLWCSADHPDQNGLRGLILAIEHRLSVRGFSGSRLPYQAGPAWPLAAQIKHDP